MLLMHEPDTDEVVIAQIFVDVINNGDFCTARRVLFFLN